MASSSSHEVAGLAEQAGDVARLRSTSRRVRHVLQATSRRVGWRLDESPRGSGGSAGVDVAAGGEVAALDELDLVRPPGRRGRPGRPGRTRGRPASGRGRGGPGAPACPSYDARARTCGARAARPTRATTSGTRSGRSTSDSMTKPSVESVKAQHPRPERGAHALGPVLGHHHPRLLRERRRAARAACSASAPRTTVTRRQPPSSRLVTPTPQPGTAVVGDQRLGGPHPAPGPGGEQQSFHAASLSDGQLTG